jgi:hypothetical protein
MPPAVRLPARHAAVVSNNAPLEMAEWVLAKVEFGCLRWRAEILLGNPVDFTHPLCTVSGRKFPQRGLPEVFRKYLTEGKLAMCRTAGPTFEVRGNLDHAASGVAVIARAASSQPRRVRAVHRVQIRWRQLVEGFGHRQPQPA